MIGAIVLFQVAAASAVAAPSAGAPRPTVSAEPVDLSAVASRIQINRKALDGWVPAKGTPAPVAPLPEFVTIPVREERRAPGVTEVPEVAENELAPDDESVNSFTGPRPVFYGAWPPFPPMLGRPEGGHPRPPHAAPRQSPRVGAHAPRTGPPAPGFPGPIRAGRTGYF